MKADDAAAAPEEVVERLLILEAQIAGVTFIYDEHVGRREFAGRRKVQSAVDDGAAIRQELAPVGKKLRVIVLALRMGLQSGLDKDTERGSLRRLSGGCGRLRRRLLRHDRGT